MNSGSVDIPPSPGELDFAQAEHAVVERRVKVGADWFFWIAGLSLIGTVTTLFFHVANLSFLDWLGTAFGLGTSYFINIVVLLFAQGESHKPPALGTTITAFIIDLALMGIYCLFGVFGRKGIPVAFSMGMVFYALDTLVCLLLFLTGILAFVFHACALYCLSKGLKAAQALRVLNARQAAMQAATPYAEPAQPGVWPPPPGAPYNP